MENRVYVYTRMAWGRQMDSSDAPAEWEDSLPGWNENALVEMDAANWESSYWKLKVIVGIIYFNYVGKPCDSRYLYLDMGVIVELLRIHLLQNAALLIVVLPKAVLLTMNR